MVVNAFSRSLAVVASPVTMLSLTVKIPSASTPASAAVAYSPADSHFHSENTHCRPPLVDVILVVVEHVRAQDIAHVGGDSSFLRPSSNVLNQPIRCDRRIHPGQVVLGQEIRVGAGSLPNDDVVEVEILLQ